MEQERARDALADGAQAARPDERKQQRHDGKRQQRSRGGIEKAGHRAREQRKQQHAQSGHDKSVAPGKPEHGIQCHKVCKSELDRDARNERRQERLKVLQCKRHGGQQCGRTEALNVSV